MNWTAFDRWVNVADLRGSDAELLQACAEFDTLERAYLATYVPGVDDGPEWDAAEAERDRLGDAQEPLADCICELRAVTREGQVARARSLALWDAELMKPKVFVNDLFTQAIVRDLLAGSAGGMNEESARSPFSSCAVGLARIIRQG